MLDKPTTADEYPQGQLELVKATCLSLVVALGDLANDVVVVGGLVPALLIFPSPDSARRETYELLVSRSDPFQPGEDLSGKPVAVLPGHLPQQGIVPLLDLIDEAAPLQRHTRHDGLFARQ